MLPLINAVWSVVILQTFQPSRGALECIISGLQLLFLPYGNIRGTCHEITETKAASARSGSVPIWRGQRGFEASELIYFPSHDGDCGRFWVQQEGPGWTWSVRSGVQGKTQKGNEMSRFKLCDSKYSCIERTSTTSPMIKCGSVNGERSSAAVCGLPPPQDADLLNILTKYRNL